MSHRLILALALSFALHGAVLLPDIFKRLPTTPPPPALQALLRLPPAPEPPPAEPLLKNTLDDEVAPQEVEPTPPPPRPRTATATSKPKPTQKQQILAAQKKLAEYVFYPQAARQLGLEGTVQLFVELSPDGSVEDVRIVASSGHAILDNAAIKGFYAVGKLPGESDVWAYTFRLIP